MRNLLGSIAFSLLLPAMLVGQAATPRRLPPLDGGRGKTGPKSTTAAPMPAAATSGGIVGHGISRPPAVTGKQTKKSTAQPAPQPAQVVPPAPVIPQRPPRPSEMPTVAPRISYENGQLTIIAPNSTMADVIAGIRSVTGVKIETVGGPSGDRIAAKIGPAPVRSVLLSLLQGSRYDYVMLGSERDPEQIERVILSPRVGGGPTQTAAAPLRPAAVPEPEVTEDNAAEDESESAPAPEPAPEAAPVPVQPGMETPEQLQQQQLQQQQPNQQQPNQPRTDQPSTPRTPEQLLEDLKRLEQERQQQQQQQERPR